MIDLDESCLFVDDDELVLISQSVIAGTELSDRLVVLIEECGVAMAMTVSGVVAALEAEENIFPFVTAGLEVGGPDREVGEA